MALVRTHHYTVDPADLPELLARRAAVIAAVRAAHPGLSHTRLTRLDDGTFTDAWRWDTAEQMHAALAAMPIPEARAAMSLTRDATAQDGEIVDERCAHQPGGAGAAATGRRPRNRLRLHSSHATRTRCQTG